MPPQSRSPIVSRVKSPPAASSCNGTVNIVTFFQMMFASGTHQMHGHGQMLVLITCSEHRKIWTNHITSGSGKSRESRRSGRLTRSTWRQDISQYRRKSYHVSRVCTVFSQEQVDQAVPLQTMTKAEVMSTQLAPKNPPDMILPNVANS